MVAGQGKADGEARQTPAAMRLGHQHASQHDRTNIGSPPGAYVTPEPAPPHNLRAQRETTGQERT